MVPIKNTNWLIPIVCIQIITLFGYFGVNISNVGDKGTALPVLGIYIFTSMLLVGLLLLQKKIYIRFHLILFLLIVTWISFRIIVDTQDINRLKQTTIATTGGILLFYLLGGCLSIGFKQAIVGTKNVMLTKIALLLFFVILLWLLFDFSQRMRTNLFLLSGVDGIYQRPGNFLSILFITASYLYLNQSLKLIEANSNILSKIVWLTIYTSSALIALVTSQMIGSNSATAITLGVYLITLVITLVAVRKKIYNSYFQENLALPLSKKLVKYLLITSLIGLAFFIVILTLIIYVTGFDLTNLRVFGFGSGTNTSLQTRIDILLDVGATQLEYAPFFGNYNVAFLTTGIEGKTLHSFLPFVMANLGIVGLCAILILFYVIFRQLYRESKFRADNVIVSYHNNMLAIYGLFILLFVFLFANIATGVSWPVLWFVIGFVSKPFGFSR